MAFAVGVLPSGLAAAMAFSTAAAPPLVPTSTPLLTEQLSEAPRVENSLSPQLIPDVVVMVVFTAEVSAGQRSAQLLVFAHILMLMSCLQVLVQQQSSAMLSFIEPDRSSTSSTSVGTLVVLEVCTPQLASLVGAGPVVPPAARPGPPPPPTLACGRQNAPRLPVVPPPVVPPPDDWSVPPPPPPTVPGELLQPSKAMLASRETIECMSRSAKIVCFIVASGAFVTTVMMWR